MRAYCEDGPVLQSTVDWFTNARAPAAVRLRILMGESFSGYCAAQLSTCVEIFIRDSLEHSRSLG